jgi:phosphonate transport system substrate-binding protein
MARDGLVFATHRSVEVRNLTIDEIRRIYSGEITNWRELGGHAAEIVVLDRPDHTSPKIAVRKLVFGDDLEIVADAVVLERPSQMVVSLDSLENAIGYASLPEILAGSPDVNVLSLDGVAPVLQNVEENLYRLTRHIGLVFKPQPSRAVMRFVDFTYRNTAQHVMRSHGYSPVLMHLVIATIPERLAIKQEERYRPLVDYLSGRLGDWTKVSLKHLPRYDDLVAEFMRGEVNSAFFGSFTYAHAQATVGVEPVARPETAGNSWYRGLILARKDSGIESWEDLKGKRFAMIRDTTAGDIFPRVYLKRHGVDDHDEFFGEIVYAGSHDTSVRKVLSGEVDAGAAKDLVYARLAEQNPRIPAELTVLAESLPVPENALVIRADVHIACVSCHEKNRVDTGKEGENGLHDVALAAKLRRELLGLHETGEGREVLETFGADRFVETSDADYKNLYDMITELGIDLARH